MSCAICGREVDQRYKPFCSRRCADMDLARWMNGSYAVPSDDPEDMSAAHEALATAPRQQRNTH